VRNDTEAETSSQSGGARPRPADAELVLPAVQVDIAPARCRRRKTTRCAPGIAWTHGRPSDRRGKMENGSTHRVVGGTGFEPVTPTMSRSGYRVQGSPPRT